MSEMQTGWVYCRIRIPVPGAKRRGEAVTLAYPDRLALAAILSECERRRGLGLTRIRLRVSRTTRPPRRSLPQNTRVPSIGLCEVCHVEGVPGGSVWIVWAPIEKVEAWARKGLE